MTIYCLFEILPRVPSTVGTLDDVCDLLTSRHWACAYQGAQPCTFYTRYGICKFGPTCKFDHPLGGLPYSPSASSLTDMPVAPYPIGSSPTTLAPSSSSSETPQEAPPQPFVSSSSNEPAAVAEEPPGHNQSREGANDAPQSSGTTGPILAQAGQSLSMSGSSPGTGSANPADILGAS